MDLEQIRRTILVAIASDELLVERLVLKGGNALALVHGIGKRSSLDVDFSTASDLDEVEAGTRMERALVDRFDAIGYRVFDFRFSRRPPTSTGEDMWGGYEAVFKLISREAALRLGEDVERMRRESELSGSRNQRVFKVSISRHEYCGGKAAAHVDDFELFVYPPVMIAAEKLRAICQQMPEYVQRRHPAPRSRDFYDIHAIVKERHIRLDSPHAKELIRQVFAAKEVPLHLLGKIESSRAFHRQDWSDVADSVKGEVLPFDVYFDFVVGVAKLLQPLWHE